MLELLPQKLDLDGTYEETIAELYRVFCEDFKRSGINYKGMPVVFDNRIVDGQYEEGFWHIITRGKDQRLLDYKRAKRIGWIKPIIENSEHSSVLKWSEEVLDKKGKKIKQTYIWFRDGKYLIILKEIPGRYFLTTAFYITGPRNDKYYYNKYEEAKKKGPEC